MGLEIKKNNKGEFQVKSTISDELYHPEKKWVSLDETKKILIVEKLWKFIDDVIKIDMDFPQSYRVNDMVENRGGDFNQWWLDNVDVKGGGSQVLLSRAKETLNKLDLDINFNDGKID